MVITLDVDLPAGKACSVCFTFDFDAISLWTGSFKLFTPTEISRGEFDCVGARRILELLKKHSIKSTWFVPGTTIEFYPDIVREIVENGHEIGHHGYNHENPQELTLKQEMQVLIKGIKCIEELTGKRPLGYRAPAWEPTWNTLKLLESECFLYDSSMMAHDYLPYKTRSGDRRMKRGPFFAFGKEKTTGLVEIPVSWNLDDFPYFEFLLSSPGSGLRAGSSVLENWINDFEYMRANIKKGVYTITFHPQVIGRGHRMMVLEKLIEYILNYDDVWCARMIDIARACKSKR